jgi:hypothetical protein
MMGPSVESKDDRTMLQSFGFRRQASFCTKFQSRDVLIVPYHSVTISMLIVIELQKRLQTES